MYLVAIDPGVKKCGVAWGFLGAPPQVAYVDTPAVLRWDTRGAGLCVIELPQIRTASRMKGDPEDILQLAKVCGQLEQHFASQGLTVELPRPSEWKGTIKGDMHNARVMRSAAQLRCHEAIASIATLAASYAHNAIDALGIHLWRSGLTATSGGLVR